MALTQTYTTAAITAGQLRIPVNSTSGFPAVGSAGVRQLVWIDNEKMLCIGVPVAGMIDVAMRGYDNSAAVAHNTRATVLTSATPSDFASPAPGRLTQPSNEEADLVSIGSDMTIFMPLKDTKYTITKATAAAIVLDPTLVPDAIGKWLTFISNVAAAHTITYTPGFNGDTTASDTATFNAAIGATLTLQVSSTGLITINAVNGVTIT